MSWNPGIGSHHSVIDLGFSYISSRPWRAIMDKDPLAYYRFHETSKLKPQPNTSPRTRGRFPAQGSGEFYNPNATGRHGLALYLGVESSQGISLYGSCLKIEADYRPADPPLPPLPADSAIWSDQGFTISCWVKPIGTEPGAIFSPGEKGRIKIKGGPGGFVRFEGALTTAGGGYGIEAQVNTNDISLTEWTHLIISGSQYEGINVWVGGTDAGTDYQSDWASGLNFDLGLPHTENYIGPFRGDPDHAYSGGLDEFAIWDRVLLTEEKQDIVDASAE